MSKKSKIPNVTTPRTSEELNKVCSQLIFELGQSEYQVYVHTANVISLKQRILDVNQEANLRNRLDAAAKPEPTQVTAQPTGAPNA